MTIEQELKKLLCDNGMFEHMAEQVVNAVKADPANESMQKGQDRWQEESSMYPAQLMAGLWVSTQRHAVKWIDANLPRAWYRPIFAEALPRDP